MINRAAIVLAGAVLLGGTAVASASESSAPQAASAESATSNVPALVNAEAVTFETSSDFLQLFTAAPTKAQGFALIDKPCELISPVSAMIPSTCEAERRTFYSANAPELRTTKVGEICAVDLIASRIRPSDPATGTIRVTNVDPATASFKYEVKRTSAWPNFIVLFGVAMILGLFSVRYSRYKIIKRLMVLVRASRKMRSELLPRDYEYGKAWASTLAAVAAIGTAFLGAAGFLSEYLPQYVTAGIVGGNVVVAIILALGPAVFGALYATKSVPNERALYWASGITVTGVSAQLFLDFLLLANVGDPVLTAVFAVATVLLCWALIYYVGQVVVQVPKLPEEDTEKKLPAAV